MFCVFHINIKEESYYGMGYHGFCILQNLNLWHNKSNKWPYSEHARIYNDLRYRVPRRTINCMHITMVRESEYHNIN